MLLSHLREKSPADRTVAFHKEKSEIKLLSLRGWCSAKAEPPDLSRESSISRTRAERFIASVAAKTTTVLSCPF